VVPATEVERISMSFPGTLALDSLSLSIAPGEIHALLGENGSGKSTFIKILSGYHRPDPGGRIMVGGLELPPGSPRTSYAAGLRFVHQNLGLVESESVLDNLSYNTGYPTRMATVAGREARRRCRAALVKAGLDLDPGTQVADLSPAQRTGVAVARALRSDDGAAIALIVLDEPTATLPDDEVRRLHAMVRTVAAAGTGVLYVTHRLDEIFGFADIVTVLRDGRKIVTAAVRGLDHRTLLHYLVGTEFEDIQRRPARSPESSELQPMVTVDGLQSRTITGVSFMVRPGEVVGIAGITGSGREELCSCLFGGTPRLSGEVLIDGQRVAPSRPDLAMRLGAAYVPADRAAAGAILPLTARENLTLARLHAYVVMATVRRKLEQRSVAEWFERLQVRPRDAGEMALGNFSGGNQQKVIYGKWLNLSPRLLLLDEPTQGVDVGAKAILHQQLIDAAADGAAVVVSSSDADELAALCQRVLVLRGGRIAAMLCDGDVTVPQISAASLGVDLHRQGNPCVSQ
jgi:ribose transport system ATP-binding protein